MKKALLPLALVMGMVSLATCQSDIINKELRFDSPASDNMLVIENIQGDIAVEGYSGQTVKLSITKKIDSRSEANLEKARQEVDVGIVEKEGVILVYMKTPCYQVDPAKVTQKNLLEGWNRGWDKNCRWEPKYDYRIDYKVQVPKDLDLKLSTVNDGEVTVKDVNGQMTVNNVNGGIRLEQISGATEATTINGDVDLSYAQNPSGPSRFYTLNGDINAFFKKDLSAEMYFKSFQGEFFTNLDGAPLPPRAEVEKGEEGISYKLNGGVGMKVGNGTTKLEFETFNGNVYVKEH